MSGTARSRKQYVSPTFWAVLHRRLMLRGTVAQRRRGSFWHWHALRTARVRLRRLDWGKHPHHWLWPHFVLHVRTQAHSAVSSFSTLTSNSRRHGRAKILARIVLEDPHIRSYADIGRKAFGPRSMPVISAIFGLELFTVTYVSSPPILAVCTAHDGPVSPS